MVTKESGDEGGVVRKGGGDVGGGGYGTRW